MDAPTPLMASPRLSSHSRNSSQPRYSRDANGNIIEESMFRRPKKLIVCCDGTWMNSDSGWVKKGLFDAGHLQTPSNITRLARSIKPEDCHGHPQIVYYQAGIGTGLGLWSQIMGGGTGAGFSENIREAYAFLANNYAPHDGIFLTGFSRGAYTARSLGGLIGQMGLLHKHGMAWFYDIFNDWQHAGDAAYEPRFLKSYKDHPDHGQRHDLKLNNSSKDPDPEAIAKYLDEYRCLLLSLGLAREAKINAIGVFDTVGALGIPVLPFFQKLGLPTFLHSYKWTDTTLDNHVRYAFQALALDEKRSPFYPSIWEKSENCTTQLKQVWFAGVHTNIGGGSSDESAPNLSLAWMMDQLSGDSIRNSKPDDWHVHDWLEFDPEYLSEQYRRNKQYHERLGLKRSWGMGILHNSLKGLTALPGQKTRAPGRTRPFVHNGDYVDETRLLRNTNEMIHASVRARIDMGGASFEVEPVANGKASWGLHAIVTNSLQHLIGKKRTLYAPQHHHGALVGWELKDAHSGHKEGCHNNIDDDETTPPVWVYVGDDKLVPKHKVLPEDVLGTHEVVFLNMYRDHVVSIQATNLGIKSTTVLAREAERRRQGSQGERAATM